MSVFRPLLCALFVLLQTNALSNAASTHSEKALKVQCGCEYRCDDILFADTTVVRNSILDIDAKSTIMTSPCRVFSSTYSGGWDDSLGYKHADTTRIQYQAHKSCCLKYSGSGFDRNCMTNYRLCLRGNIRVVDSTNIHLASQYNKCYNEDLQLHAEVDTDATCRWNPSEGLSDPTSTQPTVHVNHDITYTCTAYYKGCSVRRSVFVHVFPMPEIIHKDTVVCCANSPELLRVSGARSYQWRPTTGLDDSTSDHPVVHCANKTKYTVYGVNENGCIAQSDIWVLPTPIDTMHPVVHADRCIRGDSIHLNLLVQGNYDKRLLANATWHISAKGLILSNCQPDEQKNEYVVPFSYSASESIDAQQTSICGVLCFDAPDTIACRLDVPVGANDISCISGLEQSAVFATTAAVDNNSVFEVTMNTIASRSVDEQVCIRCVALGTYAIEVLDQLGHRLFTYSLNNGFDSAIRQEHIAIPTTCLASGWYILVAKSPSGLKSIPFIVN